jgi:hypothetical protein
MKWRILKGPCCPLPEKSKNSAEDRGTGEDKEAGGRRQNELERQHYDENVVQAFLLWHVKDPYK